MERTLLLGGLAVGSKDPDHGLSTFPVPTPDGGECGWNFLSTRFLSFGLQSFQATGSHCP